MNRYHLILILLLISLAATGYSTVNNSKENQITRVFTVQTNDGKPVVINNFTSVGITEHNVYINWCSDGTNTCTSKQFFQGSWSITTTLKDGLRVLDTNGYPVEAIKGAGGTICSSQPCGETELLTIKNQPVYLENGMIFSIVP